MCLRYYHGRYFYCLHIEKQDLLHSIVKIDQSSFEFFGQEDGAWTKNKDKEVISAMQKGMTMIIQGYSSRGTLTSDTYTLKGFTAAFNKLSKDC